MHGSLRSLKSIAMRRDIDLCRRILLELEAGPALNRRLVSIEGRDQGEISYHVGLLKQAGFVAARDVSIPLEGLRIIPTSLTHLGHEFLEASRNATFWEEAKRQVEDVADGVVLEVMYEVLKRRILQELGMGVDA